MITGRSDIMDILKEENVQPEAEDPNIRNVSTLKLNTPNTIILLLQARAAVIHMLQKSEDASERYTIVTFLDTQTMCVFNIAETTVKVTVVPISDSTYTSEHVIL